MIILALDISACFGQVQVVPTTQEEFLNVDKIIKLSDCDQAENILESQKVFDIYLKF